MDYLARNLWLIIATAVVAIVFVGIPFFVPHDAGKWPPSLGDWGDYIGGAMALIAFIWLMAGHLQNQEQIASSNRDMQTQLEMTREVVGALATIAAGNKVQASEVLADAKPLFVFVGSTGDNLSRNTTAARPVAGNLSFRNEGAFVTLVAARVNNPELTCQIEGNSLCATGSVFKVHVLSKAPLKSMGPFEIAVEYKDKFQISGWASIRVKSFGEAPEVQHQGGRPNA